MRYLTYPERQAWEPLKRGDVVAAEHLGGGRGIVYLLLEPREGGFSHGGPRRGWECLVLHSDAPGLEAGQLCTPAEDFLESGERL